MKRKLLFVPVLALWLLGRGNQGPERVPDTENARRIRVLAAPAPDVVPRSVGYGVVRPGRVWNAVPEVGGRVVDVDPRLRTGKIIKEGTILLRIDRCDYDLEVAQAVSQIRSIGAQIEQLDVRRQALEASLAIEKRSLRLVEAEPQRVRTQSTRELCRSNPGEFSGRAWVYASPTEGAGFRTSRRKRQTTADPISAAATSVTAPQARRIP